MGSKRNKKESVTVPGLWTVPVYIEEEDIETTHLNVQNSIFHYQSLNFWNEVYIKSLTHNLSELGLIFWLVNKNKIK